MPESKSQSKLISRSKPKPKETAPQHNYQCTDCVKSVECKNCTHCTHCIACYNCHNCYNCIDCNNCILCTNLNNKQEGYWIQNTEVNKKEFDHVVKKITKS